SGKRLEPSPTVDEPAPRSVTAGKQAIAEAQRFSKGERVGRGGEEDFGTPLEQVAVGLLGSDGTTGARCALDHGHAHAWRAAAGRSELVGEGESRDPSPDDHNVPHAVSPALLSTNRASDSMKAGLALRASVRR